MNRSWHGPLIDMILSIYLHWTRLQYKYYFGNFFHGPTCSWCSKPDPRNVVFILGAYLCFFNVSFIQFFIQNRFFFVYKELISEGKFRVHRVGKLYSWAHSLHRKWSCISRTLGDDMLAARCLMLNSYLIDRYFFVHLTINIGDVKLSTNVVFGRNGLCVNKQWALWCMNMRYCSVISSENNITCQDKIFFKFPKNYLRVACAKFTSQPSSWNPKKMECDMLRPFFSWWP